MVEWKKLGDICEIIRGNGVQKTDFVESGVGCIHYGQIYTHYGPFTYTTNKFVSKEVFEKARKASKGDIIMTDTSENVEDICKSVAYLGEEDIAVSNHALILKHKQNPKFLTYSTLTNSFLNQKRKYVVGAKVSGIKPEKLAQIKIYLPSLSEQQRIVEQLDTFTSSIENLKEQIAQRRKQYEYYRDQLLDLEGKEGVEMKTLGEVCEVYTGGEVPINTIKGQTKPTKQHPYAVYTNGKETYGYTDTYKIESDAVCISSIGANTGAIFYKQGKFTPAIRLKVLVPQKGIDCKYLFYACMNIDFAGRNTSSVPNINANYVKSKIVAIVPLSEQQRIVSILDTFESSINNLEQQLAQREKQYEYYRNKLLTFE
ncbi:restriction endonuclease subunit S [uncultured Prevotella sp.]|uniref:restriction endonuclease subunit S n=1 Tax=uncultured Prevotella sp. TaxID=159272 RepID=UPI0025887673|nr:restriction endonuclease subunit S [uncultured Prevotella sp.]